MEDIMKVALLSCTSKKKSYKCSASEMYSESPRFALAYEYAKMTCDEVYVLSAKYGLIPEDMEIEPYDETLKDKSTHERRAWSEKVLHNLNNIASFQNDEFLVLAGVAYNEYILPHLKKYELPLKGESLGNWIPKLRMLIDNPIPIENTNGISSERCKNIEKSSEKKPKVVDCSTDDKKCSTNQIRNYIEEKLKSALKDELEYLDVISGDIHRDMNLKNRMPSVCGAMYHLKNEMDEVLSTTPSGKSSTIKIRYYLKK